MTERPILFSTPMVQAVLGLIKKITRRLKGLELINENPDQWEIYGSTSGDTGMVYNHPKPNDYSAGFINKNTQDIRYMKCPYGKPSDVLWVRETWQQECVPFSDELGVGIKATGKYVYLADGYKLPNKSSTLVFSKWKPSIHMPKTACRIFLEITNIRVERLKDISEEHCLLEGIRVPVNGANILWNIGEQNNAISFMPDNKTTWTQRDILFSHWAELWCKINGRESWDANPWVWVIEFKV